jgi:hypothetical protein
MAVKKWVWVVVAIVALFVLGLVGLVGAGFWFVSRHVQVEPATALSAERRFQEARDRFKGSPPLIVIEDEHALRPRMTLNRTRKPAGGRVERLSLMAWDPDEDRLVSVSLPMWLLRLGGEGGRLRFGDEEIDLGRANLTVADLERYGPGLILDHKDERGVRVLLWAE